MSVRRGRSVRERGLLVAVAVDALATLAAVAGVVLPVEFGGLATLTAWGVVLLVAAIAAMLVRRRTPRIALAATVLLMGAAILAGGALAAHMITVLFTVFAVGARTDRRTTIVAAAAAIVVIWTTSIVVLGLGITDLRGALLIVAALGFAAAAGDASRSRRAYIDAVTDRARRAEETKDAEARRRVADERVAIARDLHDLVAHQIAVVSLNAGAAERALTHRPDDARRALRVIRDAAQTVLGEISGLLTVLRTTEDGAARLEPGPGLAGLDDLVRAFEANGLTIRRRTEGTHVDLPPAVDAVAYRAAQEALTNAVKHAGGDGIHPVSVLLHVEYRADEVVLTVTNPLPSRVRRDDPPEGHGLRGVAERVASVHGRLDAGAGPGPVFRFAVRLPVRVAATVAQAVPDLPDRLVS